MNLAPVAPAPTLAAPGAGLPWIELWVARLLSVWRARRTTRVEACALFAAERAALREMVRGLGEAEGRRRVLIPRPPGLEDNSRFWSAFMILDHLRIVNTGTAGLIVLLARWETPERVVGPADVKPSPEADAAVIPAFEAACAHFEESVVGVADLSAGRSWPHPWFGSLNAARWHYFTAAHMRLHRRQMATVLGGLRTLA